MANDKYVMLDLNDSRSVMIAEAMANKTCKKILSILADKELSENDIAGELKLPLNTVEYNLKKLLSSGLIEKSKNFFWSVRGKRISTYKLANKKIIISTKSKTTGFIASALVFGALGFFGNVLKNIIDISRRFSNVPSSSEDVNLIEPLTKVAGNAEEAVASGGALFDSAINSASNSQEIGFSSLFSNTSSWILIGVLLGILGYFTYTRFKYLKGGNKL